MPASHRRVMDLITQCRSGTLGEHIFQCPDCHRVHLANSSCGNRHCPICQADKSERWVDQQMEKLLPCSYFFVTFTVPEALSRFMRSHQKACYEAFFAASSEALKLLVGEKRFVGCDQAGFLGVLHTWGRTLTYHPHVHYLVPGGGLNADRSKWVASKRDFLVHVKPLSLLFRRIFRERMESAGLLEQIAPQVWHTDWVVHCQAVGNGMGTVKYLAPYIFRVAISDSRIVSVTDGRVRFRYRPVRHKEWKVMELEAAEFIRRFLQHVLPRGFMKVRHYGFLSAACKVTVEQIRELICVLFEVVQLTWPVRTRQSKRRPLRCSACGALMTWVMFLRPGASLASG
jgi:hypothetical protein